MVIDAKHENGALGVKSRDRTSGKKRKKAERFFEWDGEERT